MTSTTTMYHYVPRAMRKYPSTWAFRPCTWRSNKKSPLYISSKDQLGPPRPAPAPPPPPAFRHAHISPSWEGTATVITAAATCYFSMLACLHFCIKALSVLFSTIYYIYCSPPGYLLLMAYSTEHRVIPHLISMRLLVVFLVSYHCCYRCSAALYVQSRTCTEQNINTTVGVVRLPSLIYITYSWKEYP